MIWASGCSTDLLHSTILEQTTLAYDVAENWSLKSVTSGYIIRWNVNSKTLSISTTVVPRIQPVKAMVLATKTVPVY